MSPIRIIDYRPEHQPYFELFNRAWIEKYFEIEPRDIAVLERPREVILDHGGAILIAEYEGNVAGVAALKKMEQGVYEFTKMAVQENYRRKGIAEQLCIASFRKARELGARTIILFSNSVLHGAIALYEKIGFKHLPVGDSGYKRSDVKMMITIEDAMRVANSFHSTINA
jgi:N-acetylglutamate synthase-like GNAT family acetyltransferase